MSRCYPYRLVRSGASGGQQALIETIKLHCEKENPKTESLKGCKRVRKEKRKDRKEKEDKPYALSDGKVKRLKYEESCKEEKDRTLLGRCLLKGNEGDEAERLEKSSITDEHDEPVCYLSDGTQNSSQRKRQPSASITPSITVHKNIIRIRLPSQKHRETDASLSKGQSCSTFGGAANSLPQGKETVQLPVQEQCHHNNDIHEEETRPILASSSKEGIAQFGGKTADGTSSCENKVHSPESVYKSLVGDWVPPPFLSELNEVDDQEWLFGTKHRGQESNRLKAGNDVSCHQDSTLWPRAHHLPEADIYALPYTIPF